MKAFGENVLGGHEEDVVRTLSGVFGKSKFVAGRMTVSRRDLKRLPNQRGGGRRDREDLVCQSCPTAVRTVFTI